MDADRIPEAMTVGIVGAGLAGLACGIRLRMAGIPVTIFEKGRIPALKVCGEYLSLEVLPLLERLGILLNTGSHPLIDRLTCEAEGHSLIRLLPLGGIGISRQALDGALKVRFLELGGKLVEQIGVTAINATAIRLKEGEEYSFDQIVNASGRLNPFSNRKEPDQPLFVGYKKQVAALSWPKDRIHLQFYPWGYFGVSAIEGDRVCICLLVRQDHLKSLRSIDHLIDSVRLNDPLLDSLFHESAKTVAVSNFQFYTYESGGIPTIGDAGGNIPPVVGNGMSLAIQAGERAALCLLNEQPVHLTDNNRRIRTGLFLNSFAMSPFAGWGLDVLGRNGFPFQELVMRTHGQPT